MYCGDRTGRLVDQLDDLIPQVVGLNLDLLGCFKREWFLGKAGTKMFKDEPMCLHLDRFEGLVGKTPSAQHREVI